MKIQFGVTAKSTTLQHPWQPKAVMNTGILTAKRQTSSTPLQRVYVSVFILHLTLNRLIQYLSAKWHERSRQLCDAVKQRQLLLLQDFHLHCPPAYIYTLV